MPNSPDPRTRYCCVLHDGQLTLLVIKKVDKIHNRKQCPKCSFGVDIIRKDTPEGQAFLKRKHADYMAMKRRTTAEVSE